MASQRTGCCAHLLMARGSRRLHWGQSRREKGREIPCAPTARGRRLRLAQAGESARPPATRKRGSAPRLATAGQRPAPSNSGAAPRAKQQRGSAPRQATAGQRPAPSNSRAAPRAKQQPGSAPRQATAGQRPRQATVGLGPRGPRPSLARKRRSAPRHFKRNAPPQAGLGPAPVNAATSRCAERPVHPLPVIKAQPQPHPTGVP